MSAIYSKGELIPVLIVGGGPAGYTAAVYAARAGLKPVLYQGPQPGGQLMGTTDVENYPGYPKGTLGPDMMADFKKQAERFGAVLRTGTITKVDLKAKPFLLTIDDQHQVRAQTVIVSTGSSAKWLGIPSEKRLNGKGVSACAVCDGFFFRGEEVAVVGGGDSAAEEALYLSNICKKVYLLVRRDKMRASAIMQRRVERTPNITIFWNTETQEILGKDMVTGVSVMNNKTQELRMLAIKGFFIAIGHTPNTKPFEGQLKLNPAGYIVTKNKSTETNVPGVFAAGDVQDPTYRQAVTAAGSGCKAALDAERYLSMKSID